MCTMEWKEVEPEQSDWEKQVNIVAYYGSVTIGSIVYCGDEIGWQSVIDGRMDFMQAKSLEDAKREMIDSKKRVREAGAHSSMQLLTLQWMMKNSRIN